MHFELPSRKGIHCGTDDDHSPPVVRCEYPINAIVSTLSFIVFFTAAHKIMKPWISQETTFYRAHALSFNTQLKVGMGHWIMMDRKHVMVQWFMVMSLVPLHFVRQSVLSVRFGLTAPKMYFFVSLVPIIKCSAPDAPRCSMGISIEAVAFGLDKSVIHRIVSLKPELIFIVFRCPGWGLLAFSSNCWSIDRRNGRLGNWPRN